MLTIFSAALTDEDKEKMVEKYTKLMETDGGKVTNVNKWGVKKFAYPINYKKEGYYVLFNFEAQPYVPEKISKLMNIDESVMRSLCLKVED